jgi:hypothetical protein
VAAMCFRRSLLLFRDDDLQGFLDAKRHIVRHNRGSSPRPRLHDKVPSVRVTTTDHFILASPSIASPSLSNGIINCGTVGPSRSSRPEQNIIKRYPDRLVD